MRLPVLRKPTIQAALFIGIALVVVLWGYTGYEFTMRMAAVEAESAQVTVRYLEAQEHLTMIRSQVLVASVYVRDALLETDRTLIPRYESQIEETYQRIDAALRDYEPVIDSSQGHAPVERLRREIDGFRQMTAQVLQSSKAGGVKDVRAAAGT